MVCYAITYEMPGAPSGLISGNSFLSQVDAMFRPKLRLNLVLFCPKLLLLFNTSISLLASLTIYFLFSFDYVNQISLIISMIFIVKS